MHNLGRKSLDRASWDLDVDKSVWIIVYKVMVIYHYGIYY